MYCVGGNFENAMPRDNMFLHLTSSASVIPCCRLCIALPRSESLLYINCICAFPFVFAGRVMQKATSSSHLMWFMTRPCDTMSNNLAQTPVLSNRSSWTKHLYFNRHFWKHSFARMQLRAYNLLLSTTDRSAKQCYMIQRGVAPIMHWWLGKRLRTAKSQSRNFPKKLA